MDLAVATFGRLDVGLSNAGLLRNQKITELTLDDFHALVRWSGEIRRSNSG